VSADPIPNIGVTIYYIDGAIPTCDPDCTALLAVATATDVVQRVIVEAWILWIDQEFPVSSLSELGHISRQTCEGFLVNAGADVSIPPAD